MRGTNQNRETLQDRAVDWETHLEIEAPQCSLQQSPTSPTEAVWGSTATAVPSLYKLCVSQEKYQTSAVSMPPVTVQLYVPNKAIRQDEKANVREQWLLREKFCKLIIEVIISSKKKEWQTAQERDLNLHTSHCQQRLRPEEETTEMTTV